MAVFRVEKTTGYIPGPEDAEDDSVPNDSDESAPEGPPEKEGESVEEENPKATSPGRKKSQTKK